MARKEDELVERIRAAFPPAQVPVGIGDDAAVLDFSGRVIVTTDTLIEGIDFFADAPLELVGRKAMSANLSDLAAMGSRPCAFLLTLGAPAERLDAIDALLAGLASMASEYHVSLVGGDLTAAPSLMISITMLGKPSVTEPLLRSAAVPGDIVYVSRPLGGAAAGLELYRRGWRLDATAGAKAPGEQPVAFELRELVGALLRQHLAPLPETELGNALGAIGRIHACIDISDGFSTDLHRLCRASDVGAVVEWERIPIFPDLASYARALAVQIEDVTLHGGEEYALLFTSSLREYELSHLLGRSVYAVGRITKDRGVILERGDHMVPLGNHGYDHFSGA